MNSTVLLQSTFVAQFALRNEGHSFPDVRDSLLSNPPQYIKEQNSLISPRPGGDVFLKQKNYNVTSSTKPFAFPQLVPSLRDFHTLTFSYFLN